MEQYKATYMYQLTRKQSSWPKKNKKTQKKNKKTELFKHFDDVRRGSFKT